MGLLILATACLAIWKAPGVSDINVGNNGESECQYKIDMSSNLTLHLGYYDMGALYNDQWSMDC